MNTLLQLLLSAAINFAIAALTKKKRPNEKHPTIEDVDFPTASEDRPVPVVWGKTRIYPNCVWAGDFKAEQQTKKVAADAWGLIKEKVPIGCHYYAGMQLVLCHDKLDSIDEVWVEKRKVWSGPLAINEGGQQFVLDSSWEEPGEEVKNGVHAIVDVIANPVDSPNEPHVSAYLASQLGEENTSAGLGLTYLVWRGPSQAGIPITTTGFGSEPITIERRSGFFGSRTTVPKLGFVVSRQPNVWRFFDGGGFYGFEGNLDGVLGFANFFRTTSDFEGGDANPAWCLAELLTNPIWGCGLPGRALDQSSFCAAAQRLKDESLGFSYAWQQAAEIRDVIAIIEQHCNGTLRRDPATGRLTFKLARDEDQPVLTLTPSNTQMREISRTATDEAVNEVKVPYRDRDAAFKDRYAIAKDRAGIEAAGGKIISTEVRFDGVQSATLAAEMAMRELRAEASSLLQASLTATVPAGTLVHVGDVVTLNWPSLSIQDVRMRVTRARYADALTSVELDLTQDVFRRGSSFYVISAPSTGDGDFSQPVTRVTSAGTFVAPYALTGDDADHLLYFAYPSTPASSNAVAYRTQRSYVVEDTSDTISTSTVNRGFAVWGWLSSPVKARDTEVFVELASHQLREFKRQSRSDFYAVLQASWYRPEWIFVGLASVVSEDDTGGIVRLSEVKRGVFDTVPRVFGTNPAYGTPGTATLLFDYEIDPAARRTDIYDEPDDGGGSGDPVTRLFSLPGETVSKVRALGVSANNRLSDPDSGSTLVWTYEDLGPVVARFLTNTDLRAYRPCPPAGVQLNGIYGIDYVSSGLVSGTDPELLEAIPEIYADTLVLTWFPRNRLNRSGVGFHSTGDGSLEPGAVVHISVSVQPRPDRPVPPSALLKEDGTLVNGAYTVNSPIVIPAVLVEEEEEEEEPSVEHRQLYPGDIIVVSVWTERTVGSGRLLGPSRYQAVFRWNGIVVDPTY